MVSFDDEIKQNNLEVDWNNAKKYLIKNNLFLSCTKKGELTHFKLHLLSLIYKIFYLKTIDCIITYL